MKPRKLSTVSEKLVPRGDGRNRRVRRNLYECPVCAASYEACELNVGNGFAKTCGKCDMPTASVALREPKSLNLGWLNGRVTPKAPVSKERLQSLKLFTGCQGLLR